MASLFPSVPAEAANLDERIEALRIDATPGPPTTTRRVRGVVAASKNSNLMEYIRRATSRARRTGSRRGEGDGNPYVTHSTTRHGYTTTYGWSGTAPCHHQPYPEEETQP